MASARTGPGGTGIFVRRGHLVRRCGHPPINHCVTAQPAQASSMLLRAFFLAVVPLRTPFFASPLRALWLTDPREKLPGGAGRTYSTGGGGI